MPRSDERPVTVPAACFAVWFAVWAVCAISPNDRMDWFLENLLTFAGMAYLLTTFRWFRFSDRSYVQLTAFLILHAIGGHYTYSLVPAGDWMKDALGLERNHFDRVVHFAFGLLMLRPMRELGFRNDPTLGRYARLYFSTAGVGLWSMAYEVLEWLVAAIVDPAAGTAYLGTQGDVWDAQKDMGLALLGAFVASAFQFTRDGRFTTE
jgi:putative membrane protein